MNQTSEDLSIIIVAPFGKDAELAGNVLKAHAIQSEIHDLAKLGERLSRPAGALFITEEAVHQTDIDLIYKILSEQESWSDLPIILVLTRSQKLNHTNPIIDKLNEIGNLFLLERPFGVMTFITMVKVAIKARIRQYQVRDLIKAKDEALNKRDEFLNIASHELKTPITALKLQIQLRRRAIAKGDTSVFSPEKVQSLLEATDNQVERIYRLVDEMLDVARINSGMLTLNPKEHDLNDIVTNVASLLHLQFSVSNVPLKVQFNSEPRGLWDKSRIEQVIINLMTNALKYGKGSPVTVLTDQMDSWGTVTVIDEGPGISKNDQQRIFDRYERAKSQDRISGLGLGLYISKKIIELHGGEILLESKEGKGSKFTVKLPILLDLRTPSSS